MSSAYTIKLFQQIGKLRLSILLAILLSFLPALGQQQDQKAISAAVSTSQSDTEISDVAEEYESTPTQKKSFFIPYEKVKNHEFVVIAGNLYFFTLGSKVTKFSQNQNIKDFVRIADDFASPLVGLLTVAGISVFFADQFKKNTGEFFASMGLGLVTKAALMAVFSVQKKLVWQGADNPYFTIVDGKFYHLSVERPNIEQLILEEALNKFKYVDKAEFKVQLETGKIKGTKPIFPKLGVDRRLGQGLKHALAFGFDLALEAGFSMCTGGASFISTMILRAGFDRINAALTRLYYNVINTAAPKYKKGELAPKYSGDVRIAFVNGEYHYVYLRGIN